MSATKLNDEGYLLWRFAGAKILTWQIGELHRVLHGIFPQHSDEEIEQMIFRYFVPDN